jgi:hypothetical protein
LRGKWQSGTGKEVFESAIVSEYLDEAKIYQPQILLLSYVTSQATPEG